MPRKSSQSVTIDSNVRCLRVYPTEDTKKQVSDLKTVGIKLSRNQAIHLARVLLAVSQDWEDLDITAYRLEKRKSDGTYKILMSSQSNRHQIDPFDRGWKPLPHIYH